MSNFAEKQNDMKKLFFIALITLFVGCIKVNEAPLDQEDAALVTLLDQVDQCQTTGDREKCYNLYSQIAAEYEKKNLTELQKQYQQKMLNEAEAITKDSKRRGHMLMAEALQQLATAHMVEGQLDSASIEAHQAYQLAPSDTLDFRAQTLLLLAQIHLMAEEGDSVEHYIMEAKRIYPKVVHTDLYRITHAYGLGLQQRNEDLMAVLPSYIAESGIHGQAELTRLLMYRLQEANRWQEAYDEAINLMDITDSIARTETSENLARIHALQHERQMEFQRAERKAEQARLYVIIIVVLLLLLATAVAGLFYRRKARIAHARELEAMRLSEAAQTHENLVREDETGYHHKQFCQEGSQSKKKAITRLIISVDLLLSSRSFVGSITTGPSVFIMKLRHGDSQVQAIDCPWEELPTVLQLPLYVRAKISMRNHQQQL